MPRRTNNDNPIGSIKTRGWFAYWMIAFGFVGLTGRLGYLQIVKGQEFKARASKLRLDTLRLAAKRGAILDRNGRVLAEESMSASVEADPTLIKDKLKTAEMLSPILGEPVDQIVTRLSVPNRKSVMLARQLTPERAQKLQAMKIVGVFVRDEPKRVYPNDGLAAQVLGFVNLDNKGLNGIELSRQKDLAGKDGFVEAEVDAQGRVIPETRRDTQSPLNGQDLTLTIDAEVQLRVEQSLKKAYENSKAKGAMAIVLIPQTGEIAAMATFPNYNLNERGEALAANPSAEQNRCISNIYEPGSTFKLLTIAAAWEEGKINNSSTTYCPGRATFGKVPIRCAAHAPYYNGHGVCDPEKVMEVSCNIGAAHIGEKVGAQKLYDYTKKFGLLEKYDLGLPGELRGRLTSPDSWINQTLTCANVSFGQGLAVTPLGMASLYSTIANDGVWVQPRIVKKAGANEIQPKSHPVVSASTAQAIRQMLVQVVEHGTAKVAQVDGYTIGGKTGTAQKIDPVTKRYTHSLYLSSFIGMFPASKPQAVILVMIDEPKGAYYGGVVAAPVFQEIAEFLTSYWKIAPDKPFEADKKGKRGRGRQA